MPDDWTHADGKPYQYPILQAERAHVYTASWLREDGVDPIILLQVSGALEGLPFTVGIELTNDGATKVADGLTKAVGQ